MAGRRLDLSDAVVKTLFALSGNVCAFIDIDTGAGCEERLTDPSWPKVKAEIAHIRGVKPTSPRYDPGYTEVNNFENLILLCPNHHTRIDDLEPHRYTVQTLEDMKHRSMDCAEPVGRWASEERLNTLSAQLVTRTLAEWTAEALLEERATEQAKRILAGAINRLPDQEKILLTLYYYEDLPLVEVSKVLGVPEGTARQLHERTILMLRSRLSKAGVDPEALNLLSPNK